MGKMREYRLRWFEHITRKNYLGAVRVVMDMNVKGKRRKEDQRIGKIE